MPVEPFGECVVYETVNWERFLGHPQIEGLGFGIRGSTSHPPILNPRYH